MIIQPTLDADEGRRLTLIAFTAHTRAQGIGARIRPALEAAAHSILRAEIYANRDASGLSLRGDVIDVDEREVWNSSIPAYIRRVESALWRAFEYAQDLGLLYVTGRRSEMKASHETPLAEDAQMNFARVFDDMPYGAMAGFCRSVTTVGDVFENLQRLQKKLEAAGLRGRATSKKQTELEHDLTAAGRLLNRLMLEQQGEGS